MSGNTANRLIERTRFFQCGNVKVGKEGLDVLERFANSGLAEVRPVWKALRFVVGIDE